MCPNKVILSEVTASVASLNNPEALRLCLTSILMGSYLPAHIHVRLEGEIPSLNNFYSEQLLSLARFYGVFVSIFIDQCKGVHWTRSEQLAAAKTEFLWLLDDDVIVEYDCLEEFDNALQILKANAVKQHTSNPNFIYLQGNKPDVNNRRSYQNFSAKFLTKRSMPIGGEPNYNCFYNKDDFSIGEYHPLNLLDTGNAFFNVPLYRKENLSFFFANDHAACSGEDVLFALTCRKKNLPRFWVPRANVVHLEKPSIRISDHANRKELVYRTAEQLGLDLYYVNQYFLAWEPMKPTPLNQSK